MTSVIFCDGACKGNGYKGAVGGWAFAFWPGPKAYGEPQTAGADKLAFGPGGEAPTNQRAELKALLESLIFSKPVAGQVIIHTDSQYAMNCTEKWGPAWKKAGWKRSSGEPLQNLDLIKPLVEEFASLKSRVSLKHVRGHQTNSSHEAWGNNWVDRAAVAGATGIRLTPGPSPSLPGPSPPPFLPNPPSLLKTARPVQADLRSWFK